MSPPPSSIAARESFLATIRAADLFNPTQFARLDSALPKSAATPMECAQALLASGLLTRYQAERLAAGRTDGFHLGPYIIQEPVGRGAMGRVYRAKHRTMNRSVAIKILSSGLTRTESSREEFHREVRAAAQLNHPNVVTAYDANEFSGRFYLVLEYVDGPNFESLVRSRGPLPVAEACELARQVAVGLDHAHEHRIIHREIKPANLLIARPTPANPDYLVKIADFGVAKLSPWQTVTSGGLLGTPDFVAPEQAHDPRQADHRADLYSLGAVLFFLLTGQPPFPGGTVEEKIRRHLWEEPVRIDRCRYDLHPAITALVHQLLAKNPAQRPSGAMEVAERLGNLVDSCGMVNFDLPARTAVHHSVSGTLSGCHAVPMAEAVNGTPATAVDQAAVSTLDASPWSQITVAAEVVNPSTSSATARHPAASSVSSWTPGRWTAGLFVAGAAALSVMIRAMAR
jgi:serine/threonine-protein kinase